MSIQTPRTFTDNTEFIAILESISMAESTLHQPQIHNFKSPEGKALRNQLRDEVKELQRTISDAKVSGVFSQILGFGQVALHDLGYVLDRESSFMFSQLPHSRLRSWSRN